MFLKLQWRPFLCNPFSPSSLLLLRFLSSQETLSKMSMFSSSHHPLGHQSYVELSQSFYESLKACGSLKSAPIAQKIHAKLISLGLDSSIFLRNLLLHVHFTCGLLDDALLIFKEIEFPNVYTWNTMIGGLSELGCLVEAENVFEEMPVRDTVSWNSMMSGYFHNGQPRNAVKLFSLMLQDCRCVPNTSSFACAMKACAGLGYLSLAIQLHGLVHKFEGENGSSVVNSLVDMYIQCGGANYADRIFSRAANPSLFCWNSMIFAYSKLYGAERALDLFYKMPERDSVSWNTMISILCQYGFGIRALELFVEMWNQGFRTNSMTYASILSASASIYDHDWGAHLHSRIIRTERNLDLFIGSSLIDMHAKCGCLKYARRVFDSLEEHNTVSWTSLIRGIALFGLDEEVVSLFNQMRVFSVTCDDFTIATVLGVCGTEKNHNSLDGQLHAYIVKLGMDSYLSVGNALVTAHAKSGNFEMANLVFKLMPVRDIISWTSMITAFSLAGFLDKARDYFDKMPERNVITWNSMLTTYMQRGFWEEGFKLYTLMLNQGVKPDWVTIATSIGGCADSAVLRLGSQMTAQAKKFGFASDISVANSLLRMYSRCGQIIEARRVFDSIATKDLISWNAMMTGYAQHGQGRKVIEIFENMLERGCMPDQISYISVLSGCSHSGLLTEAQHYFNSMVKDHGISPLNEHYTCMVDLLGRAGMLEQALNMIDGMPFKPNATVWGALLGACRIHGNTKLAEFALESLHEMDAESSGSYALIANVYSDCGKLDCLADVRKLIREKRVRKDPGCSWIEVHNKVHVFTVDDTNHPQIDDVYKMLKNIIKKIEGLGGNVAESNSAGSVYRNSDKICLAFG